MFGWFKKSDYKILAAHWKAAHKALGFAGEPFPAQGKPSELDSILEAYAGKDRFYHGIKHLVYGLATIDQLVDRQAAQFLRISQREVGLLKLAFFYHDIVYDVRKKDNEEQSAIRAQTYTSFILNPHRSEQERITELILNTANHQGIVSIDPLWMIMNDADLAIFVAPDAVYRQYAENVWKEYSAIVDRNAFVNGRIDFLRKFISEPIFNTETMIRKESLAKANIMREIIRLSSQAA